MEYFVAGVDEAGRGPLIGDLFMAIVVIEHKYEEMLKTLGVKDSKKLSRSKREKLFSMVIGLAKIVAVTRIPPSLIDRENINLLETKALCRLISKVQNIVEINSLYVDAFASPSKIKEYIDRCIEYTKSKNDINIIIEHNADSTYTIVGAASIIAKVLRDTHINKLKILYGDFGSGYPSDKLTIEWLKTYYNRYKDFPPIVRRSWKTVKNLLKNKHTLDKYIDIDINKRETDIN